MALAAASMSYLPQNQFGYVGLLPASTIMDLLVIVSTAFALLLTLMREQRAALIAELDRKGVESESQRRMLETVFDSMSDGVLIVDGNRVSMFNAAARQLLGRPIPGGTPATWAGDFGLSAADGGPLSDEDLREALWVDTTPPCRPGRSRCGSGTMVRPARSTSPPSRSAAATSVRPWCCSTTSRRSAPGCAS